MARRSLRTPRKPLPPAIVVSRYNGSVTERLLEGALAEYEKRGGRKSSVVVLEAPGAFELPVIAHAAAAGGGFSCVVALGCLVKGETRHDEYLAAAVAHALALAAIRTGVPIAFGVLTVDTPEQALARAGGRCGNKGSEAMAAALDAAATLASIGRRGARIRRRVTDKVKGSTKGAAG